jgi:hypothetical protein
MQEKVGLMSGNRVGEAVVDGDAKGHFRRLLGIVVIWITLVAVGAFASARFASQPAAVDPAPSVWPVESSLWLDSARPTLIAFFHPRCPCSRATLAELGVVQSRCPDRVATRLIFVCPPGMPEGWQATDMWQTANAFPGAEVITDEGGSEAKRFGATTSGEVFLFTPDGRRVFRGGVTWSRGHEGESIGRNALISLIRSGGAPSAESPVFGCPLMDE